MQITITIPTRFEAMFNAARGDDTAEQYVRKAVADKVREFKRNYLFDEREAEIVEELEELNEL